MNRIGVKFGVVMAAIIWPVSGLAGPCDAHFTFDRTLADASGNGYDGEMIDAQGGPAAAAFTDGRFGQALQLDGPACIRHRPCTERYRQRHRAAGCDTQGLELAIRRRRL